MRLEAYLAEMYLRAVSRPRPAGAGDVYLVKVHWSLQEEERALIEYAYPLHKNDDVHSFHPSHFVSAETPELFSDEPGLDRRRAEFEQMALATFGYGFRTSVLP